ncbi:PREDICTED: uncharacterized protein LOC108566754 [Nicrophorus vespilloides]|uniref:Uncharacterized protein LOC108566754 n=1 Tax=Nicrophorus vespilloides TaxID=110193 RepID=A0ABM1N623_NICVS|nr:PREDICTED: uncharacterized protein LOC108566754 [Nicrophorus vespilloides]
MADEPQVVVLNWIFNLTNFLKFYNNHTFTSSQISEELLLRSTRTPVDNQFFTVKKYHPNIYFKCTLCGETSFYFEQIHKHLISKCHLVDINIACPYCCSRFSCTDELVEHILHHLKNDEGLIRLMNDKTVTLIDKYL